MTVEELVCRGEDEEDGLGHGGVSMRWLVSGSDECALGGKGGLMSAYSIYMYAISLAMPCGSVVSGSIK